jgi:hypothetical protein
MKGFCVGTNKFEFQGGGCLICKGRNAIENNESINCNVVGIINQNIDYMLCFLLQLLFRVVQISKVGLVIKTQYVACNVCY